METPDRPVMNRRGLRLMLLWLVSLCLMTVVTVVNMVESYPGSRSRNKIRAAYAHERAELKNLDRDGHRMRLEMKKLKLQITFIDKLDTQLFKHDKAAAGFAARAMQYKMHGHPRLAMKQLQIAEKLRPLSKQWRALLAGELRRDQAATKTRAK